VEDSNFYMFYVLCLISCMHTLNFQTYLVIYIFDFNFTLCTLSFYIDLIKLKFGPVENRCVYTYHLHIIFHATHFMMNPCHLVVSGLVIIVGFSCD